MRLKDTGGAMKKENMRRLIARVQTKEIIRRQATIRPWQTMFDGVCPVEYGLGSARIPSLDAIRKRVRALEHWIDTKLPPADD